MNYGHEILKSLLEYPEFSARVFCYEGFMIMKDEILPFTLVSNLQPCAWSIGEG